MLPHCPYRRVIAILSQGFRSGDWTKILVVEIDACAPAANPDITGFGFERCLYVAFHSCFCARPEQGVCVKYLLVGIEQEYSIRAGNPDILLVVFEHAFYLVDLYALL